MLDDNQLRALRAEASAELTCAEVIGTVMAAEVLVRKRKTHARMVAQGAVEQVNLAQERVTKAVVVAKDQIDKAEALADQALERSCSRRVYFVKTKDGVVMIVYILHVSTVQWNR